MKDKILKVALVLLAVYTLIVLMIGFIGAPAPMWVAISGVISMVILIVAATLNV